MMCLETFKEKYNTDFVDWQGWVDFANKNWRYSLSHSTVFDFVGKCNDWQLPSYHPYWENYVKINNLKTLETLRVKYAECVANPDKIKYHFNISTSLEMIAARIVYFERKTKGIVYQ